MKKLIAGICLGAIGGGVLQAQTFFKADSTDFIAPTFPANTSESAIWEAFTQAYNAPNNPTSGTTSTPPTITQVLQPDAILTGGFHIYAYQGPLGFELADTTPLSSVPAAGSVKSVNFQWDTEGTLMDFNSLKLIYTPAGGGSPVTLSPTNFITEYSPFFDEHSPSPTYENRMSAQWDLSALNVGSYKIVYQASGPSDSFSGARLDTANTYTEITPSTRTWNGAGGNTNWSTAANWGANTVASARGNVIFSGGSGVVMDSAREVSAMTLSAPGGFTISGSSKLQTNTGITTLAAASATNYQITAPLAFGAFNWLNIGANTTLAISQPVTGAQGFRKYGDGTLKLLSSNTFSGLVLIEAGTTYLTGTNAYDGGTTISGGALIIQSNAGTTSGVLGTSTSDVVIGSYGNFGTPEAALIADGALNIAKNITVADGTDFKKIGAQNTGAGTATFSGNITLTQSASNLNLYAANATDRVVISGSITGGGAGLGVFKTGNGTVVLSGATAKTYANNTTVSAGTLELATGATLNTTGGMTVSSGAKLLVNGQLQLAGTLTMAGGTLGGNGSINRAFTLTSGSTLSPGNIVGNLTTSAETWANGSKMKLDLSNATSTAGVGWDLVTVNGTLNLSAANGQFTLQLQTLDAATGTAALMQNFNPGQAFSWLFATSTTLSNFAPTDITIDASGFANSLNGGSFSVSASGNNLLLNFTPVPEPNAASLCILGIAGLAVWRNRRFISGRDRVD